MDAYSEYNQIRMHPQDEAKPVFIIDSSTFCYKVMPFGLKNTRATYQRLMDKIFKDVIGTDMEVYVDDMVVKSTTANEHCSALDLAGIEANPEKCQAVINMKGGLTTGKENHDLVSIHILVGRNDQTHFRYPKKGRKLHLDA
ncbi:hypothetical protein CR513_51687, partial [Mucuna pruriens]